MKELRFYEVYPVYMLLIFAIGIMLTLINFIR